MPARSAASLTRRPSADNGQLWLSQLLTSSATSRAAMCSPRSNGGKFKTGFRLAEPSRPPRQGNRLEALKGRPIVSQAVRLDDLLSRYPRGREHLRASFRPPGSRPRKHAPSESLCSEITLAEAGPRGKPPLRDPSSEPWGAQPQWLGLGPSGVRIRALSGTGPPVRPGGRLFSKGFASAKPDTGPRRRRAHPSLVCMTMR